MGLFSKDAREAKKPVLLVDIGSGSVAVALVTPGFDQNPARVHLYQRASLKQTETPREETQNREALLETAKKTIEEVVNAFSRKHKAKNIVSVTVALHAPWAQSTTHDASKVFETETVISDALVGDVAKEALQQTGQTGFVFERAALGIEVNGYPTNKPAGKKGVSLRVISIQSTGDQAFIEKVKEVIAVTLPERPIIIRSSSYITLAVLQPMERTMPDYTFVDLTSEVTNMLIMRDGLISGTGMAPVGWRTLIRKLAEKYGTAPEEAASRLRMAIEESCTDTSCTQVVSSLNDLAPQFITAYGALFGELAKETRMPAHLILVSPPDVAQWFADLLGRIDFVQFTNTGQPFGVQHLLAKHLAEKVIFEPGLVPDAGVATGAAFVHMRTY